METGSNYGPERDGPDIGTDPERDGPDIGADPKRDGPDIGTDTPVSPLDCV